MSDTETERWIAALERARTELEAELEEALAADSRWRALRAAVAARTEHERALAGNPVYRCWAQLDAAIAALRREPQAGASPAPGRRRISLRDVLEHIRSDPDLPGSELDATSVAAERPEPSQTAPSGAEPPAASVPTGEPTGPAAPPERARNVGPEPEEASVSFVIREPARAKTAAREGGDASAPKQPEPPRTEPEADPGIEAEVTIVPRRR